MEMTDANSDPQRKGLGVTVSTSVSAERLPTPAPESAERRGRGADSVPYSALSHHVLPVSRTSQSTIFSRCFSVTSAQCSSTDERWAGKACAHARCAREAAS
jgi:hypothetical protein